MSKYDIHKWKDGELNERLMEKWGYKKKVLKEEKMPMKTDTEDADEDGDTTDKVPAFLDKGETKKKKKGGKIPPQLEPHVRKAQGKKGGDNDEEEREDVNEGHMDMNRMGVPMVAGGDVEGMANAAIAAIVQLAAEAGVQLDVTSGEDALPDDMDMDMEDEGGEAEEQELMDPEDL
tara:strand:+ start:775 stop:1302 length:528 start_codon:yes stop_codon:yes gene_type:complete